jgi:hypothetical protein
MRSLPRERKLANGTPRSVNAPPCLRFRKQESSFAAADEPPMNRVNLSAWPGWALAAREWTLALGALAVAMAGVGCTPKIGDKCTLSTDCSQQGTLVCDTSQPEGYCTQLNCTNGSCPNSAVCVEFQSSVPGCGYNDYQSPSRTGRSFCMAHCSNPSDCRQSEGYTCSDPTSAPWNAAILDNNQSQSVCIVSPVAADASASPDAAVCMSFGIESGDASDGASDDASDVDAERGVDAADAAHPEELDAGIDSGFDATLDAPIDTGSADAPGGG